MRGWVAKLAGLLAVTFVGMVVGLSPLGFDLEKNLGLRWLFTLRGPIPPPSDVVVVGIDDQTGGQLGLSRLPRDWPRTIHAKLVESLVQRGATTIVFDFDFQTPKQLVDDTAFAKAIESANRVVLTEKLVGKRQPIIAGNGHKKGAIWVEQLVTPIRLLADAAKGAGTFPLPKVDVAVHEFWAFKDSVGSAPTTPAMALQIQAQSVYPELVNLLQGADAVQAHELPQGVGFADRTLQTRNLMIKLHQLFQKTPQLSLQADDTIAKMRKFKLADRESQWLHALVGLYAGDDNRYLNFYGPPGTITTVPYHALLGKDNTGAGNSEPDLSGKVVFVGYSDLYDPNQPDRFYTVYTNSDGVDLSGVEIAATAYGNLATNRSLTVPTPMVMAAILFLFGALTAGLIYLLPAIVSAPLTLLVAFGYFFAAERVFAQHDVWLPVAVPLLQLPLVMLVGLGSQYLSERRKKKWATQAISYYIPENMAKQFAEKNLQSDALNKVVYSVCFASDMAGFTTISEQLPPKELAIFLNDYFDSLAAPLRKNKVDVIEFRADGIMCAWTAESNSAAIRHQAAMAALDAVEAIAHFSQRHPTLPQRLRIGLEVGMVYVGHSGGGGHYVYSIVGDCANTAARIEGLNKKMGTQVLASRSALADVDNLLTRYLGDFQFVGKTEALPIVEIIARKEMATALQSKLCKRYQEALNVLGSGDFGDATSQFEAILLDYPEDGPARFHLAYCQQLASQGAVPDNPLLIQLDSK